MGNKIIDTGFDPSEHPMGQAWFEMGNCIRDCERAIGLAYKKVKEETAEKQKNCDCSQHIQEPVMINNKHYLGPRYGGVDALEKIFSGSRCSKCCKFIPRKEGSPYSVCHKCGADMKDDGYESFQGGREDLYKCSSKTCFHQETRSRRI